MEKTRKTLTLCLATNDGKILLGMKKRGFGANRWKNFRGYFLFGEGDAILEKRLDEVPKIA